MATTSKQPLALHLQSPHWHKNSAVSMELSNPRELFPGKTRFAMYCRPCHIRQFGMNKTSQVQDSYPENYTHYLANPPIADHPATNGILPIGCCPRPSTRERR